MQKSFTSQAELFVSATYLDHPILHSLDDTEALLDWAQIEQLLSPIYNAKTGRPSYPLLTLFRSLLLGIWYGLSDVQLAQFGIEDQVQRKGYRNKPLSCADQIRNQVIAVTRSGVERPFATYKRHYGLARTRFMGLAKNATVYGLAAMAANIRKGAKFLTLYGLPDPHHAG